MYRQLGTAILGLLLAGSPLWAQKEQAADKGQPAARGGRPYLGVLVAPTERGARERGVVVREVAPDSPASRAGLQSGDVITRVDGRQVEDPESLVHALARHKPGDKVSFQVLRDDRERKLQVALGKPRQAAESDEGRSEYRAERGKGPAFLGVEAVSTDELSDRLRKRMGIAGDEGAVVLEVLSDSPAGRAGLRHGDVITAVNGQDIDGPDQLRSAVRKAGAGKEVRLEVMRGRQKKQFDVRLESAPVDGVGLLPMRNFGDEFDATRSRSMQRRIDRMERRIQELERRLNELQGKKKSGSVRKDSQPIED